MDERELRRRAERQQREREQNQEPVDQATHRSVPIWAGFKRGLLQHFAED